MEEEGNFEDYTKMTEGTKTDGGGVVARCPRCGALGRLTEEHGLQTYEHRRTSPEETRVACVVRKSPP